MHITKKILIVILLFFPIIAEGEDIFCVLPNGIQLEPLIQKGEINHPYFFRIGYQKDIYLVSNGICMNLYNTNAPVLAFPKTFKLTDVYWVSDSDCLFSDSSSIYHRNEKNDTIIKILHTSMQQIQFRISHNGIYYYDGGGSELFFYSFKTYKASKLCQFEKPITDMSISGNNCFVAYGSSIGMIIDNKEHVSLLKNDTSISSIAIGANGTLFYGTKDGLFYFDNENHQFPISTLGVLNLYIYKDDLYIVFSNSSSAVIHGISLYKQLTEKREKFSVSKLLGKYIVKSSNLESERSSLRSKNIEKAVELYSKEVLHEQEACTAGSGVRGELLAEYAYSLALNHDFEAALMNIDRARMVGTKYGDFYAAQVLTLMGYDKAAQQLMKWAKVPEWINGIYQGLNERYRTTASINRDAPKIALKRANKLAANRQTIQAIALFEELAAIYPNTYITYVDYSTVWESLGYFAYAAQLLQKGIELIPEESETANSLLENKQVFKNHLTKVNHTKASFENATWLKRLLGMTPPKIMTYIGASAAKDIYSLNGRTGLYTINKFSASLNVGLNYASDDFSGSIGLSGYKAWGIFVGGLGITDMISKEQNIMSLTPSVGLSFLNKDQASSFDIMLNGYVPFSSDQKFSYSISVGKTIYFDLNGLLK